MTGSTLDQVEDGKPLLGAISKDTQATPTSQDTTSPGAAHFAVTREPLSPAAATSEASEANPSQSRNLPRLDTSTPPSRTGSAPPSASDALPSPSHGLPSATDSISLPTATSSRQQPPSRPPSRPPSLSRPPSVYRPRSSSSVSRLSTSGGAGTVYGGPGTNLNQDRDPKRLSVSSSSAAVGGGGPASPAPTSPSLAQAGAPVSPRIPEDATVSSESTTASTDETTPSPVAEESTEKPAAEATGLGLVDRIDMTDAAAEAGPAAAATPSDDSAADEIPVIVRDYAFPRHDPRFDGKMLPEEIEAAERRKRFRESQEGSGVGGAGSWMVDEDGMGAPGAGPGVAGSSFHWGFVTSHASDFPGSEVEDDDEFESTDGGYAFHDPAHATGFGDYEDDVEGGGAHGEEGDDEGGELGEFVPGVYSAVYAFEPELETEMRLVEGELVSVFERQCRGWVQAGRIVDNVVTEEIGLVPENYLALVEPHEGVVDWSTHDDEAADAPLPKFGADAAENTTASLLQAQESGATTAVPA